MISLTRFKTNLTKNLAKLQVNWDENFNLLKLEMQNIILHQFKLKPIN